MQWFPHLQNSYFCSGRIFLEAFFYLDPESLDSSDAVTLILLL
jgi:hypothetical protein